MATTTHTTDIEGLKAAVMPGAIFICDGKICRYDGTNVIDSAGNVVV